MAKKTDSTVGELSKDLEQKHSLPEKGKECGGFTDKAKALNWKHRISDHALHTLEKGKATAKAKLDDAKQAADQEYMLPPRRRTRSAA